jgi:hypothetical protein
VKPSLERLRKLLVLVFSCNLLGSLIGFFSGCLLGQFQIFQFIRFCSNSKRKE